MKYPIVKIKTADNIELHGLMTEPDIKTDKILINIHGTASNFYMEDYAIFFAQNLPEQGIAVLFTNNRGNNVMEGFQNAGAALERFEASVLDIDAWIKYALDEGYRRIILQGHSLGTEKAVYYMNKGGYIDKVAGVILLGFSDSYGNQSRIAQNFKTDPMIEAKELVAQGKSEQFLISNWRPHGGGLPKSAASYLNFFSPGSELAKALPLHQNKGLLFYQNIKVPILAVAGDQDPYTYLPVQEAAALLEKENVLTKTVIMPGTGHDFIGKEKELAGIVSAFISDLKN
jgi:pimeloyl-ACP methyl ester carboxylesterase